MRNSFLISAAIACSAFYLTFVVAQDEDYMDLLLRYEEEDSHREKEYWGGFPGVFCPLPGQEKALANCSVDCNFAHNSPGGICGTPPDYHCYCEFPNLTPARISGQCLNKTEPMWDEICDYDCKCSHGALGGRCNYVTRGCDCIGSAIGLGVNPCPFQNVYLIIDWFNQSYYSVGMGRFAEDVLNGTYS